MRLLISMCTRDGRLRKNRRSWKVRLMWCCVHCWATLTTIVASHQSVHSGRIRVSQDLRTHPNDWKERNGSDPLCACEREMFRASEVLRFQSQQGACDKMATYKTLIQHVHSDFQPSAKRHNHPQSSTRVPLGSPLQARTPWSEKVDRRASGDHPAQRGRGVQVRVVGICRASAV